MGGPRRGPPRTPFARRGSPVGDGLIHRLVLADGEVPLAGLEELGDELPDGPLGVEQGQLPPLQEAGGASLPGQEECGAHRQHLSQRGLMRWACCEP